MKKYLKMIGCIAVYYALPIAVILLTIKVFGSFKATRNFFEDVPQMLYGVSDPFYILCMFLVFRLIKKQDLAKYSNFTPIPLKRILLFAAFGALMGMFTYSLININYVKNNFTQLVDIVNSIIYGNVFLLMYTVTINNIGKEFGFRGMIFNEMRGKMPVVAALIVQALLYGSQIFVSLDISVALYGAFGSFVFCLIYYLGKSLWSSIIAQISCTFSMVLIDRTALKDLFNNTSSKFLIVLSMLTIVFLFLKLYKRNKISSDSAQSAIQNAQEVAL